MRSRTPVLIALAAVVICTLAAALYLRIIPSGRTIPPEERTLPAGGASAGAIEESAAVAVAEPPTAITGERMPPGRTDTAPANPTLIHKTYVADRIALLQELSMDDQNSSLQTILGELSNRDPAIRKAAREAAIQFASRDAIPGLLEAAAQMEDPAEKQELIDAAEFLKLPSLTEVMQQRGIRPVLTAKPAPGKQLPAFDRRPKPAAR